MSIENWAVASLGIVICLTFGWVGWVVYSMSRKLRYARMANEFPPSRTCAKCGHLIASGTERDVVLYGPHDPVHLPYGQGCYPGYDYVLTLVGKDGSRSSRYYRRQVTDDVQVTENGEPMSTQTIDNILQDMANRLQSVELTSTQGADLCHIIHQRVRLPDPEPEIDNG